MSCGSGLPFKSSMALAAFSSQWCPYGGMFLKTCRTEHSYLFSISLTFCFPFGFLGEPHFDGRASRGFAIGGQDSGYVNPI